MRAIVDGRAGSITLDTLGLESLVKELKDAAKHSVEIGVFDERNAAIGAIHEFGSVSRNIPERSWLRFPLRWRLPELIEEVEDEEWEEVIEEQGVLGIFDRVGQLGVDAINLAFDSGGYGQWPELKQETIDRKGHGQILVDTWELGLGVDYRLK